MLPGLVPCYGTTAGSLLNTLYISDLAPSDFRLFGTVKPDCKLFVTDGDVK